MLILTRYEEISSTGAKRSQSVSGVKKIVTWYESMPLKMGMMGQSENLNQTFIFPKVNESIVSTSEKRFQDEVAKAPKRKEKRPATEN